jgi:hypothetical protein
MTHWRVESQLLVGSANVLGYARISLTSSADIGAAALARAIAELGRVAWAAVRSATLERVRLDGVVRARSGCACAVFRHIADSVLSAALDRVGFEGIARTADARAGAVFGQVAEVR